MVELLKGGKWEFKLGSYNHYFVHVFCVQDAEWQKFRLSLKGLSTYDKLKRLRERRASLLEGSDSLRLSHRHQVQIDNYINALKRGGQLSVDGVIKS